MLKDDIFILKGATLGDSYFYFIYFLFFLSSGTVITNVLLFKIYSLKLIFPYIFDIALVKMLTNINKNIVNTITMISVYILFFGASPNMLTKYPKNKKKKAI